MLFFLCFIRNLTATISEDHLNKALEGSSSDVVEPMSEGHLDEAPKSSNAVTDPTSGAYVDLDLEKHYSYIAEHTFENHLNEVLESSDITEPTSEDYLDRVPKIITLAYQNNGITYAICDSAIRIIR